MIIKKRSPCSTVSQSSIPGSLSVVIILFLLFLNCFYLAGVDWAMVSPSVMIRLNHVHVVDSGTSIKGVNKVINNV